MPMIRVHYSNSEGSSFGRDFRDLSDALAFVEQDSRENRRQYQANRATVVESDGVCMIRRFRFVDGDLATYEVQRGGRMVDVMADVLAKAS